MDFVYYTFTILDVTTRVEGHRLFSGINRRKFSL